MTTTPVRAPAAGELLAPVSKEGQAFLDLLAVHIPYVREVSGAHDRDGTFPFEVFDRFRTSGVLAATVPAELGGLGVSHMHDVALALRTLAEFDASVALALHMQLSRGLTLTYEWRYGAPEAQSLAERLMRSVGEREAIICGAVKDAPRATTRLTPAPGGGWLLNGRKTLVSLAPAATHFAVYAEVHVDEEPLRLAAPVLTRQTPGLTVLDNWDGLGMRGSGTVDIVFDNCPIAAKDVLPRAAVGARQDAVLAGQTVSSVTMLGIYAGIASAARNVAVDWTVRRRVDPGAAVRTLLAEIEARLFALRSSAAAALRNADELAFDFSVDADERGRRMMTPFQCAKLMVNQLASDIVDRCMTVVGGASFSARHPLARHYRDVRAGRYMQPYTYVDAIDYLSGQVLCFDQDNDYVSARAIRARREPSP
ncbi:acyl-CoA dehydrogenase family protein [Micromonospora aurantiaca (nom. illeg.)]|uniref:acyl-CoA dehydrogenase family protein n=1 Tax=Micromonospora aurantiaca (nom. illeg.) TaxID=47850 RepID=UPI001656F860|nr:acyl-CoA dehydrogenase family protein [Micromonospora aurantiaca]MBC9000433.1 acyl-CoA/acyl-ACP dehydrogenase [Micromonospora aurantiaca]